MVEHRRIPGGRSMAVVAGIGTGEVRSGFAGRRRAVMATIAGA